MPAITLKNIPPELYDQIKKSALMNFRSINGEILYRLQHSLGHKPIDPVVLAQRISKIQKRLRMPYLTDETLNLAKKEGRP